MMRVFNVTLFLLFYYLPLKPQAGPYSNWYFGANAGLTFNSGAPVALTNGALTTTEGVATISDLSGNLLFYTNGVTVWDRNHTIMPNGNGLNGDVSSTQSSIIVPVPNSNRYYIFTSDADATTGSNFGICYSEVDMNGNSGFGVVTANKNIPLHSPSSEKLCAVRHCNGVDIWVISRDWGNNIFRCWLVTQSGITVFSWSVAGVIVNGISQGSYGQLKASPDGSKLLACYYGFAGNGLNRVELYDFDVQTGFVTNAMNISTEVGAYGCEFSSTGQIIYVGTNGGNLIQWNISSGVLSTIQSTRTVISAAGPFIGSLQRGPDNKIYVARNTTSLSVINQPNVPGLGCNYTNLSVSLLGRNSRMGLPNFAPLYPSPSIGPILHN
jgi:hypothetical protein